MRDFSLSRRCNQPASTWFRRRGLASLIGSIGQYGAEAQVGDPIRATSDLAGSLSTGGLGRSERVDAGCAGPKSGRLGAVGEGVGSWRHGATPFLPPPAGEGPRRERRRPGVLSEPRTRERLLEPAGDVEHRVDVARRVEQRDIAGIDPVVAMPTMARLAITSPVPGLRSEASASARRSGTA